MDQGALVSLFAEPLRLVLLMTGMSRHTMIPPRGYSIAGVSGSWGQWIDGFSLIIAR